MCHNNHYVSYDYNMSLNTVNTTDTCQYDNGFLEDIFEFYHIDHNNSIGHGSHINP